MAACNSDSESKFFSLRINVLNGSAQSFSIDFKAEMCVIHLKIHIALEFPAHPFATTQTLIYKGRELQNWELLDGALEEHSCQLDMSYPASLEELLEIFTNGPSARRFSNTTGESCRRTLKVFDTAEEDLSIIAQDVHQRPVSERTKGNYYALYLNWLAECQKQPYYSGQRESLSRTELYLFTYELIEQGHPEDDTVNI